MDHYHLNINEELCTVVEELNRRGNIVFSGLRINGSNYWTMISGEPIHTNAPGTTLSFIIEYKPLTCNFLTYPGVAACSFDDAKKKLIDWALNTR